VAGKITGGAPAKAALRTQIVAARDALPPATRSEFSARITPQLLSLDAYRSAAQVLAYMSFGSEFETAEFIAEVLAGGKRLWLPRIDRATRSLQVHCVENLERDLRAGVWGIREPHPACPRAELGEIDFVLLPGVAFTRRGERLGYGGGFYDRLIPQFSSRPPLVAGAFELQMRDEIPLDANDQRIDAVVTETGVYRR
jgi:5-formyltetrahydrofolate cyclo-ligase